MTLFHQFRLNALTFGWVLQGSLPNTVMAFMPALVTLVCFALTLPLAGHAHSAFVVAFIAGYGAQAWLRLPGLAKGEAVAMFGAESAVIIPVVVTAIMVVIGQPIGCLRVYSAFALMRGVIMCHDLWHHRYGYVQSLLPSPRYRTADAVLSQVFLGWSIVQIVLIEAIIAGGNLVLWLAVAALANILIITVDRALVKFVLLKQKT